MKPPTVLLALVFSMSAVAHAAAPPPSSLPSVDQLMAAPIALRPELVGKHPRVFMTAAGLEALRARAKSTHKEEWQRVVANLAATRGDPPPAPGPQARRAQNVVALAIAECAFAWAVDRDPRMLEAARRWMLAAIDYEPWGYKNNKPNVDLAAGHLLYAIGWAYDLLHAELTPAERARVRASLERHAKLVADHFAPGKGKRFAYTQNHDFIPTAGLGIAALALLGESPDAPRWAAIARAHHHRVGSLLSPDGYFYEGVEYWIFSGPWLVLFADAWEHATGEDLWAPYFRGWKHYMAHSVLPDGQSVFDFGDAWQGPLTRAGKGEDYHRAYPGGKMESNYNILYKIAARLKDPETQAVAERLRGFGHTNQQEFWSLVWRDPSLQPAPMTRLPLTKHFEDSGMVFVRTGWDAGATAFAFKAGPPQGHRLAALLPQAPEARLDSGHAHPDVGSFIVYAGGKTLVGDTGYAGLPAARHHNTLTIGGVGQGTEGAHDVWRKMPYTAEGLARIRIREAKLSPRAVTIVADLTGAYPEQAGLTRFVRRFQFTAPGRFVVKDEVALAKPAPVQSYLHADVAFTGADRKFSVRPEGGGVALDVRVIGSKLTARTGATEVMAPGAPGSIEKGTAEQRGWELVVESPEATSHRFETRLDLTPVRAAAR